MRVNPFFRHLADGIELAEQVHGKATLDHVRLAFIALVEAVEERDPRLDGGGMTVSEGTAEERLDEEAG